MSTPPSDVSTETVPAKERSTADPKKDNISLYAALGAIVLFLIFCLVMLFHLDDEEREWTRLTYLFAAIEAVALAAFGFLWGEKVHRERADEAQQRAQNAHNENSKAQKDLTASENLKEKSNEKFLALAKLIEAKADSKGAGSMASLLERHLTVEPNLEAEFPGVRNFIESRKQTRRGVSTGDPEWDELARFARSLQEN